MSRADRKPTTAAPEDVGADADDRPGPRWCLPAAVLAAVAGAALAADSARSLSATYDEVTYLRVAARWWRTGEQTVITRMGSPLTFWKAQQAPVLWWLDRVGRRELADDPEVHQAELLPLARAGGVAAFLVAQVLTACWSRRLYGPRAMALSAWLFALSPNLIGHGALVTMELPLVACSTGVFLLFWLFLQGGRPRHFLGAAALAGLGFSCKFTAVLLPPLLALVWWFDLWRTAGCGPRRALGRVAWGMAGFVAVMLLADCAVTGFALLPAAHNPGGQHPSLDARFARTSVVGRLARRVVETPVPQDWAGFAAQWNHQRTGGPSYLLGERRTRGWWYYYFVALAVKVPLSFWVLAAARAALGRRAGGAGRSWVLPLTASAFLAVTAAGSSRNYGVRYLLPLSPLAVVWVSALAERRGWPRAIACVGLVGQALAVASVHPDELTYFNEAAGGRLGGRRILADSNLDWGQGLGALARLQRERPELRDLTLYYFGDTRPEFYGVAGTSRVIDANGLNAGLPPRFTASTQYVAVSASLQWGPWGPPGYFRALDGLRPVAMTRDTTIAVYRTADVFTSSQIGQ